MIKKSDYFDEIEHWLRFIRKWEEENNESVPEKAFYALEQALEKALSAYSKNQYPGDFDKSNSDLH